VFGRHRDFIVNLRRGGNEQTFCAVAGHYHLSISSTFENGFEAVQPQTGVGFHFAVTSNARGIEKRFDIFIVSDALRGGGGWQFGNIDLGNIPMVFLLLRQN
jgi:hypothetical protein